MAGYTPLRIVGNTTGLVQEREEFILPNDAYPILQNAYVWRERIKRKRGCQLLGRLQRNLTNISIGDISSPGAGTVIVNLFSALGLATSEPFASFVPGTVAPFGIFIFGGINQVLGDFNGNGTLTVAPPGLITAATLNYATGVLTLTFSGAVGASPAFITAGYYPGLPVMGLRTRERNRAPDEMIAFDQKYAYRFNSVANQFEEFIPGTTWNAHNATVAGVDFFWSTNYWVSSLDIPNSMPSIPFFTTANQKLFWVTNNTGQFATPDPIRITDGTTWVDFVPPNFGKIDATNFLVQCLAFLPFRGRMVTFNTYEGPALAGAINYPNRIRWSTIGNPFIPFTPATGSWRSDIRGQGGFLDIPTNEDIVSVGFVRDNLVVYCERSTWQLRYTGRSISPFQIEKVNSELGVEGTFSTIQFDTSLLGIGDKGVVECDSYKSERIDIKIPDLVFQFNSANDGDARVYGIRDFINRLAYWSFSLAGAYDGTVPQASWIFPNQRLVYNYENDSWALFNDTFTVYGTYLDQTSRTWLNTKKPWIECNFPWINQPQGDPTIVAGNQQGFVEYIDELTTNDVTLFITNIVGHLATLEATVGTSPNHNLTNDSVIKISGIPVGTPYDNLNGQVFGVILGDNAGSDTPNSFRLMKYDPISREFSDPQLDDGTLPFVGEGYISIRDNFSITSKKFNFMEEGQSIQLGYFDILTSSTGEVGAFSVNIYLDYNNSETSNTLPNNDINDDSANGNPDTFFNSVIPTTQSSLNNVGGIKFWQRVICPTRANFLTIEYTFSNAQMAGEEETKDVQIDAQVLWLRRAGRLTQI